MKEKLLVVVVVFLADFDESFNSEAVITIYEKFKDLIDIGFLHLVQASKDYYPKVQEMKHNFKDNDERVKWRSKQVLDFSFLFMYSQNLSEYYIQIEDDVICAAHFIQSIKNYIAYQKQPWAVLEFSELGFIGKLFKSSDLSKLAKFMMTFYQEQPIDWLITYFRLASAQNFVLLRKPTLFQHVGLKSSFDISSDNRLQDRFFDSGEKRWRSDDPTGNIITNMEAHSHWSPELCYASGSGYFWAKDTKKGDQLFVLFDTAQKLKRIVVETGNEKHVDDKLLHGILEISPKFMRKYKDVQTNLSAVYCADWKSVGEFESGRLDTGELSSWYKPMQCLRITQTEEQDSWVLFDQIAVFVYK